MGKPQAVATIKPKLSKLVLTEVVARGKYSNGLINMPYQADITIVGTSVVGLAIPRR